MCDRLVQLRSKHEYVNALGWHIPALIDKLTDRIPHWNVPPGSQPWLLHRLGHGAEQIGMVNWGYRPAWANSIDGPFAASIRLDHAKSAPYFKMMFRNGRAIVPCDGWYEWSRADGGRHAWFIRRRSQEPLFMAAVCSYRAPQGGVQSGVQSSINDDTGFVLVCDNAPGSIIDREGLRPIVFTAAEARLWLDNTMPAETAYDLAQAHCGVSAGLEWHQVGAAVDRRGSNGRHLILPVQALASA